jgi:mannan endo-1,4-beta-mannosidase
MFIWFLAVAFFSGESPRPNPIRLEAEDAVLYGPAVSKERAGYSGTGYVAGFTKDGARIEWKARAKAGLYEAMVRYSSPGTEKGYELVVNGARTAAMFAPTDQGFAIAKAGMVELKDGENIVGIDKGWGWYDVDYVELTPAKPSPMPRKPPKTLADPKATAKTKALFAKLVATYGRKTLTGQYGQTDCDYIEKTTGKVPAILGGDFMDYSPSRVERGADPKNESEKMIAAAKTGRIVTMSWHWNAPKDLIDKAYRDSNGSEVDARWYKGFYANATTFDVEKALANPASEDYKLILRDIDAVAVQLRKFADAGIPVLWRPLHEAEGKWFWWGAKGPQAYIKLWRLMFDRLTKTHGLHNLIWVHNCVAKAWYPGDGYVDVVGVDAYPSDRSDPLSATWESLQAWLDGKKLLAVTEFGGVPDLNRMHRFGARWAYFVSWGGTAQGQNTEAVKRTYTSPSAANQGARN